MCCVCALIVSLGMIYRKKAVYCEDGAHREGCLSVFSEFFYFGDFPPRPAFLYIFFINFTAMSR